MSILLILTKYNSVGSLTLHFQVLLRLKVFDRWMVYNANHRNPIVLSRDRKPQPACHSEHPVVRGLHF